MEPSRPGASERAPRGPSTPRRPHHPPPTAAQRAAWAMEKLAIHEIRRPTLQESSAIHFRPGDDTLQNFAPEKSPHRGAVHQEVLDVLGPELVAMTLA